MKKFLSVIFMALCGITAIHAQDQDPAAVTPTLQGQRDNVACGTTVTMQATPKPNYHFFKWVNTVTHEEFIPGVSPNLIFDAEEGKYDLIIHQPASATYEAVFKGKDPVKIIIATSDPNQGNVSFVE